MARQNLLDTDILDLIRNEEWDEVSALLLDAHPADIADVIDRSPSNSQIKLFSLLGEDAKPDVLVELESVAEAEVLEALTNAELSEIVDDMDPDDAADVISDLPEERSEQVLELMEEGSDEVRELLKYEEDTAGGIMTTDVVALPETRTVEEALDALSHFDQEERFLNANIVDQNGTMIGFVDVWDLLREKDKTRTIGAIAHRKFAAATVDMDQEEVAKQVKKYDLVEIPVVDEGGRLEGRITHDDILDVIEEEAHEDISHMVGTSEEDITEPSAFRVSRMRLPWLIIGLFGGLVSALVMSHFEMAIERIITLVFFVPVVMAMGGNVGMQSSAIVVRGLATGEIDVTHTSHRLLREIRVALINGLVCGAILTLLTFFWLRNIHLGVVVGGALICVILVSTFVGTLVPLLLKRFDIDPALATGPFVTTSNDIIGLGIYFIFTTVLLNMIS